MLLLDRLCGATDVLEELVLRRPSHPYEDAPVPAPEAQPEL
jgi:hypothetical protein